MAAVKAALAQPDVDVDVRDGNGVRHFTRRLCAAELLFVTDDSGVVSCAGHGSDSGCIERSQGHRAHAGGRGCGLVRPER